MTSVDVLVIGGGPAGAATACGLAAAGREVTVLERASGPRHKVCGEFLSAETQASLAVLGVDPIALGAAAIDKVALHAGSRGGAVALPFRALSLSRYRLDEALLRRAFDLGVEVRRGVSVRAAVPAEHGWRVRCGGGALIQCRTLVLATGKHALSGIGDGRGASMVGLKIHLRLSPESTRALSGRVDFFLLPDGYGGLEPVEDGVANLCVLLRRTAVARIGPGWLALRDYLASAAPTLGARLDGGIALWESPLAVVCPAGGHLHKSSSGMDRGLYRVGDRIAHIPPFTGDGLGIALASADIAAAHIRDRRSAEAYHRTMRRAAAAPVRLASALSRIAATSVGRALMGIAASHEPWLLRTIASKTRLAA